ncbi:MAG: DUF2070 family protein [Candidatus Jordarchaeaceae archaeon]
MFLVEVRFLPTSRNGSTYLRIVKPERRTLRERATQIFSYPFNPPSPRVLALTGLLLSIVMGVVSYIPGGNLERIIIYGVGVGVFVFAVPMIISSYLLYLVGRIRSPIFSLSRSLAFCLIFVVVWEFFFFAGALISGILNNPDLSLIATFFGAVFIFSLCLVILITISTFGIPLSVLLSSILPITGITFLAIIVGNLKTTFLAPWLVIFIIAAVILAIPNFVAFHIIEKPIKKRLGVSGYELIRGFFLEWILKDSQKIDSVTDKFGEKASLPAFLVAFRSKKNHKLKGLLFSSFIHYGPFKGAGSSALPRLLAQKIEEKNDTILSVTHGACTHAQNLCSARETQKAIKQIVGKLKEIEFSDSATPFHRVHENEAKILSAVMGNSIIMISTRSPEITDDINLKVGLSALERAKNEMQKSGLQGDSVFLIDSHNCILDTEVLVEPNTPAAENILNAVEESIKKMGSLKKATKIRYGVSRTRFPSIYRDYGLGEEGITVNIIETWLDDEELDVPKRFEDNHWMQRTALIVIDGNNMIIGLRDKIISRLLEEKLVDEVEVLTSDTHTVNAPSIHQPDYYPVGRAINHEDLIEEIVKNTRRAIADLEEVEIGTKVFNISNIKIWTDKKLNVFFKGIEETVNTLKIIIIPFFTCGVALALLWLLISV